MFVQDTLSAAFSNDVYLWHRVMIPKDGFLVPPHMWCDTTCGRRVMYPQQFMEDGLLKLLEISDAELCICAIMAGTVSQVVNDYMEEDNGQLD